jgi:hypothetical protein
VKSPEAVDDLRRYLRDAHSISTDTPLAPVIQSAARTDAGMAAPVRALPGPEQEKLGTGPALLASELPKPGIRRRRRLALIVAAVIICAAGLPAILALTKTTTSPMRTLTGPSAFNTVYSEAFSPDGKTLATGDGEGLVDLWSTTNWRLDGVLHSPVNESVNDSVADVTFSPDSATLAVAIDSKIYLWNRAAQRLADTLAVPSDSTVTALAYSPGGSTLAIGDNNGTGGGHVYLWDTATRRMTTLPTLSPGPDATVDSGLTVISVAFSPDGKTLAISESDDTSNAITYLWDIAGQKASAILATPAGSMAESLVFSPGGNSVAGTFWTIGSLSGVGHACQWTLNSGETVVPIDPIGAPGTQGTEAIAYSPTGKTLATGDYNGNTYVWNAATLHLITTLPGSEYDSVFSVAFSPDGEILATGDGNGNVKLWKATWP